MYSFTDLEPGNTTRKQPVCCPVSNSSNCCFLTCIQVSQKADKVVWYFHLFKHFPQFVVIHTVNGFSLVNETEIDVILELSCFFYEPMDVGNLISGSYAFPRSNLNIYFGFIEYAKAFDFIEYTKAFD